ncbi:MAG: Asp23/Gls24 family envelope stress response protein [Spirochaetaceae bacterium]|nr:Asp23/Gls24 family envelope stress response protein [Spirochaetaceae bacterium]
MLPDILFTKKIKVFALVGASGTGKSYQAKLVAEKYRIDFIIDDGLLIRNDRIIAGHSAKEEKSFMAAVKAAVFDEKERRDDVARKLQTEKFSSVLILGTSEKMVNKIAARLQLPLPYRIIKIEEVASLDDVDTALRTRRVEGKHIIPVPSVEVKRGYPEIFFSPISVLKQPRVQVPIPSVPAPHEKSLVRPAYSIPQKLIISGKALSLMVKNCVNEFNDSFHVKKIEVKDTETGYQLAITIDVDFGTDLEKKISELRQYITDNIEKYTGILIEEVNIIIDKVIEMMNTQAVL